MREQRGRAWWFLYVGIYITLGSAWLQYKLYGR